MLDADRGRELLGLSRPFVARLLERGDIRPNSSQSRHRRSGWKTCSPSKIAGSADQRTANIPT